MSKHIYPIIFYLNMHTFFQSKGLMDIVCYDLVGNKQRFFIVYTLISYKFSMRIQVVSRVGIIAELLSIVGVFRVACWCEREVFDFFGIFFFENKDLRRILTDYGFKGNPLRKDFPLTGFVDSYFDDNQNRICFRVLDLVQEFRKFNINSS